MTVHHFPYVTNTISFNQALLLLAERLFLSEGGTAAKWARWVAAKDMVDVQESRLLSNQEQMAKQDKVEFHLFIATDVVAFMRKLLLTNDPPAYVNAGREGLFRAAPSIFNDAELIKALISRNVRVNSPVAGRFELPGMSELGSWENSYSFEKTGRIVFVAREVESALNNAAPLQVVGNDNQNAHVPASTIIATTEGLASTAKFGEARAVVRSSAEGIGSTAQCGNGQGAISTVETATRAKPKKRYQPTGNRPGRPEGKNADLKAFIDKEIKDWIGIDKGAFEKHIEDKFTRRIGRAVIEKETRPFWQSRLYTKNKMADDERIRALGIGDNVHPMRTKA